MCGIYGLIRGAGAPLGPTTRMVTVLGHLAEARGRHSAGLALGPRSWAEAQARAEDLSVAEARVGDWQVTKTVGPFTKLYGVGLRARVNGAAVVLGHDRYATQGARTLVNANPLAVGSVIGTHAGDIDLDLAAESFQIGRTVGDTDSEVLLRALDAAAGTIPATLAVLEGVIGRAVVIWIDQRWPGLVMAARTGLTTLAFARDAHGNLYWATNPRWLRTAAVRAGVELENLWTMPEGTLMLIDVADGPRQVDQLRFTATVRPSDERWARNFAHNGFTISDAKRDTATRRHRVASPLELYRAAEPLTLF